MSVTAATEPLIWQIRDREWDLSRTGLIVGILNVTPDSFSDGGQFLSTDAAVKHALSMVADGADVLDIGGESTRPGAAAVDAEEELRRVCPVIREVRRRSPIPISIDTSKAVVAAAALKAGASIVNDVTALRGDPAMAEVVRDSGAGLILMHMRGTPQTMQTNPEYHDVVGEIREFLRQRLDHAISSGIDPIMIALDPGIGFGKTVQDNFSILKHCSEFGVHGRPVFIGASRKSLLKAVTGTSSVDDRFWPGIATTSFCRERGARLFRVHDPKPHREALRMTEAILHAR